MMIVLTELKREHGSHWQVRLDQHVVTFRSEAEAKSFIQTLESRLAAPHRLPYGKQRAAY